MSWHLCGTQLQGSQESGVRSQESESEVGLLTLNS